MKLYERININLILIPILFIYLVEYIFLSSQDFKGIFFPTWMNVTVFFVVSVSFFLKYRGSNLFCFELMFLPVYFVGMFYDDMLSFMWNYADNLSLIGDARYVTKSAIIQMIAFLCFMMGAVIANKKSNPESKAWNNYFIFGDTINMKKATAFLTVLLVLVVFNIYITGGFATWNKYQFSEYSGADEYQGLGHITILTTLLSIFEYVRLSKLRVHKFSSFIRESNKVYIIITLSVSALIIYTGKRSAALLVLLPVIISYILFIKKISNRKVLLMVLLGGLLMIVAGLSRNTGSMEGQVIDLASSTRDFSMTNVDCTYLIKYTDEHGLYLFRSLIPNFLSGIPVIGPIMVSVFFSGPSRGSSIICTEGLGGPFSQSGWGTSIVGDLYYNGGFLFVVVYMLFIGWLMSYLYNKFSIKKEFNAFLLVVYVVMTANAVFSYRSAFDFIYGTIIYSTICLYVTKLLFSKRNYVK